VSNRTGRIDGLDGRGAIARRVRDLIANFVAEFGGRVDAVLMVRIKTAAELIAVVEVLRAGLRQEILC
jgi:hypothetical protein